MLYIRFLILLIASLSISGCYYTSDRNLFAGYKQYNPSQIFGAGTLVFESKDKRTLIQIDAETDSAKITRQAVKGGNPSVFYVDYVVAPKKKNNEFLYAVDKRNDKYAYLAFQYSKDPAAISWITPAKVKDFTTQSGMITATRTDAKSANKSRFDVLPKSVGLRKMAVAKAIQPKKKSPAQTVNKPAPKKVVPVRPRPPNGIDALDIGDGVYVQGFFSDELVQIVRIDRASGQVKVRRATDNTTKWVNYSRLISREQNTTNNIGRTVTTGVVIYCLFSPDSCKKKK